MKRLILVTVFTVTLNGKAWADACLSVKSVNDLLACAETRSPEVQGAQIELDRASSLIDAAAQWRNPELSVESFHGSLSGQSQRETDIALGVPLELGGKVSARKAVATGGLKNLEARLFATRAKIRLQLLLKLHRLRQLIHETQTADEAIRTFSTLIGQFSKRPGLSPEQQISSSVYQLSKSEYELKKTTLNEEFVGLDTFFKLNLQMTAEQIRFLLPSEPKNWPKVASPENLAASPVQLALQAELETANAELELASSEAWPTLTVGPSFKIQSEGGLNNNLLGMNVSLPLPVFNVNGGAKAAAAAGAKLSKIRKDQGLREQSLRREELQNVYEQTVGALALSLSHAKIEGLHRESERLIARGIVPSALIIEAHRTSFELEKTRHERELRAIEALFEINIIDGKILEAGI